MIVAQFMHLSANYWRFNQRAHYRLGAKMPGRHSKSGDDDDNGFSSVMRCDIFLFSFFSSLYAMPILVDFALFEINFDEHSRPQIYSSL